MTNVLKPLFKRSRDRIEIDITYQCNLKCRSCNRSCTQALSKDQMTAAQIRKFVDESVKNNTGWKIIRLLGGEPTLHPELLDILDILSDYKKRYLPDASIILVSNGSGREVNEVLKKVPDVITIENSNKITEGTESHIDFNNAPVDYFWNVFVDYTNGCWILEACGVGLTPYGYYYCAVAGSIDRVFGFDIGRKALPSQDDLMKDQMRRLCRYCGHFFENRCFVRKDISHSWKKAYAGYNARKPDLIPY